MTATLASRATVEERLVGDLTDAALEVTARHGVRGRSVDQELELWSALGKALHTHVPREQLVAELTDAAYHIALKHGFWGSFVDVQLDLWQALCLATARLRGRVATGEYQC